MPTLRARTLSRPRSCEKLFFFTHVYGCVAGVRAHPCLNGGCSHAGWGRCCAFDQSGHQLATSGGSTIRVYGRAAPHDTGSYKLAYTLEGHRAWIRSASFDATGALLVTAAQDGSVFLWDAKAGLMGRSCGPVELSVPAPALTCMFLPPTSQQEHAASSPLARGATLAVAGGGGR